MKAEIKFVILLIILVLLCIAGALSSCTPVNQTKRPELVKYEIKKNRYGSMRVLRFEYDGHQYIMFGSVDGRSIVHDPDCPCHKKENSYTPTEYLY